MDKPDFPSDEASRIEALRALNILDSQNEESFDRITRLAKCMFKAPIALISLIDDDRQWFKSCIGLDTKQMPRDISFCGHAILDNDAMIINDTREDSRFVDNPLVLGPPFVRFYAGYPIELKNGARIGTLCIADTVPRTFSEEDKQSLKDLTAITQREISILQLATQDELTQVFNRRGFEFSAEQFIKLCVRKQLPIVTVFIDLDSFKPINDEFGHDQGDEVLKIFANLLSKNCRKSDVCGRVGGDEFVLFLTDTTKVDAHELIKRVRSEYLNYFDNKKLADYLDFSYGVIESQPNDDTRLNELLKEADKQMFANKLAKKGDIS